jgi:hypothetical protein
MVYDGDIDEADEDIWKYPEGGTEFDPPLNLGI